jgi:hypothetical protein
MIRKRSRFAGRFSLTAAESGRFNEGNSVPLPAQAASWPREAVSEATPLEEVRRL